MGYVHDTHMSEFIPPSDFQMSAGTWAMAVASNVVSRDRSAADAAFTALIPIRVPSNASDKKGAMLKSIDVWYAIGTAAADDFATVELEKMIMGAVDTDHCMTVTLATPAWVDDGDVYWLQLVVDCAATTVFKFFGARANYTLRI